ncbi:MAG: conjugal transfer protein [Oceanospirillaceae bacterium]|jgi:TrbM protein|nr:conjugal transfer protein [Oceanospirillaceae bacterium]
MKRKLALIAVTAILSIQPAHAKDACKTVLCMAGMVQGAGVVSGCSGAVGDYFSIIKFKNGKFSPSRTASARGSFLNSCPSHSGWASTINSQYGRMRSFGF